jgi:Zn-dependent protease with chaperone function
MDFFDSQENARRRTKWLIFYFALAVAGIIAAIHIGFCILTGERFDNLGLLGITSGGVIAAVLIGSLVKLAELSKGGRVVAEMLGGIPVNPGTGNPTERRLLNVVEEMAIASGVPVPSVYILDDPAINAFAAGFSTSDAAIGVTHGCIDLLTRDELQGVIAHEFSHILNGDMRLNIRLIGILHGILFLALIGGVLVRMAALSRPRSRSGKNEGSLLAILIAAGAILSIVGWIGVFFSKLIKAAVSRQREFLADASAVQFTRNQRGIAGALAKIESHSSRLTSPRAQEASHMFFGNALKTAWFGLFATHPPIPVRIAAINPHLDLKTLAEPVPATIPSQSSYKNNSPAPGDIHLAAAASLLGSLPSSAVSASHELQSATLLAYALLLSDDSLIQQHQLEILRVGHAITNDLSERHTSLSSLSSSQKIALLELSIPTLRDLSKEQYGSFRQNIQSLIAADGEINLFEYTLQKLLIRHLDSSFVNPKPTRVRHRTITPLLPDLNFLLSAIANADATQDNDSLDAAFAAGAHALGSNAKGFPLARIPQVDLLEFDKCLTRLCSASPSVKKSILECCKAVVVHDGEVNDTQFEFLRAAADTLDCPMPPHLPNT